MGGGASKYRDSDTADTLKLNETTATTTFDTTFSDSPEENDFLSQLGNGIFLKYLSNSLSQKS